MLSATELDERRSLLAQSGDLAGLARHLGDRAARVIGRRPAVPRMKALLSVDGGVCPDDGAVLEFDPWSQGDHRCPQCGRSFRGERHDRAWARFQHLWLAEQAATLAALASLTGNAAAAREAGGILNEYASRYFEYPNRDNVLGPSRLFFSTYLESIWLINYLSAAMLLREAALLDESVAEAVNSVADEAANLIGEFDEGFSNRQVWHNAALAAIAVWFEDEELGSGVLQGQTGIVAQMVRGFGEDGMWYEGENYHLFALRGQLIALAWARNAGADLLAESKLAQRLALALRAPAITALPDRTFPARKDSRFGQSLAQPMYLELWEVGLARLGDPSSELWGWLADLYQSPPPKAAVFDSYLYEAGLPAPAESRSRRDLSWWALLEMAPTLPSGSSWAPGSVLLDSQGLAILREGRRYVSLECGSYGGGHGHPDRLHLTLHSGGRHWLADPGTGSYVSRDLFWYRSTLAHNAPRLDGANQPAEDAWCAAFDVQRGWSWARGMFGEVTRTLVAGPTYILDVLELAGSAERLLEVPWHPAGEVLVESPGTWVADALPDEFVTAAERLTDRGTDPVRLQFRDGSETLGLHLLFDGDLIRATGPGLPGSGEPCTFLVCRLRARNARLVAVLDTSNGATPIRSIQADGPGISVETAAGTDHHLPTGEGWDVTERGEAYRLAGVRRQKTEKKPLIDLDRRTPMRAAALHVAQAPMLDGSVDDFDTGEPVLLDHEDQYRRSEEAYVGPDEFCATAFVNWDSDALYLGVDVAKAEVIYRSDDAPPLRLDNDPDDLHSDGLQVYLRPEEGGAVYGFLVVPANDEGGVRVHVAEGCAGSPEMVTGAWTRTETGYSMTLAIALPDWSGRPRDEIEFDLVVNEMLPDRSRRAGQLVWSGGGGWVYLRGDRQPAARFGVLELR
ncbi:MAG TPA: heparinase II/III family protein [Gemmatimonadales bacterium]